MVAWGGAVLVGVVVPTVPLEPLPELPVPVGEEPEPVAVVVPTPLP